MMDEKSSSFSNCKRNVFEFINIHLIGHIGHWSLDLQKFVSPSKAFLTFFINHLVTYIKDPPPLRYKSSGHNYVGVTKLNLFIDKSKLLERDILG